MPPFEVRSGLNYENPRWAAGVLWRLVAAQDRYAVNQGNIVGQDLGPTGGFGVLSVNGAGGPRLRSSCRRASTTCSTSSMPST